MVDSTKIKLRKIFKPGIRKESSDNTVLYMQMQSHFQHIFARGYHLSKMEKKNNKKKFMSQKKKKFTKSSLQLFYYDI